MKTSGSLLALSILLPVATAHSAILSGTVLTEPATNTSLTAPGTIDWAIFDTSDSSAVSTVSATNVQSGGAGLISEISPFATTAVTTNNLRGVGGATQLFTYTDGTDPSAETNFPSISLRMTMRIFCTSAST